MLNILPFEMPTKRRSTGDRAQGQIIKKYREAVRPKLTQERLGEELNTSRVHIADIERGHKKASLPLLLAIGKRLDIPESELLTPLDMQMKSQIAGQISRQIPVINKGPCGDWVDFTDLSYPAGVADRYEYAPTNDPNAFYVIASGDSMTGSGISEGDLLLVEPNKELQNGCIVLAQGENGCTIKKFQKRDDLIILLPTNDKYDPIYLKESDIIMNRIMFYRVTRKQTIL
jgi:SOS-response transcriptional repressor LexA